MSGKVNPKKLNRIFAYRGLQTISGVCLAVVLTLFAVTVSAQNAMSSNRLTPLSSGKPDAMAKIEVFYDLQCPSCANLHSILMGVEKKFGVDIFITFRHFPLRIPAHDKAFTAAKMVEAAHVQGKGRQMLDLILTNQKSWTANKRARTIFFGYATALRLNMPQFREDYENEETIYRIVDDLFKVKELKLNSTPTFFLNGKQLTFIEALDIETKIKEILK